jgi:hypothetical protein
MICANSEQTKRVGVFEHKTRIDYPVVRLSVCGTHDDIINGSGRPTIDVHALSK